MKLLVIGSAVSGRAAARLARRQGHDVAVYDAKAAAVAPLRDEGIEVHSGSWSPRLIKGYDAYIASPGVPPSAEPLAQAMAAGVPIWSELEFGSRYLEAPYAAITGTNGKTTTVVAAAAMLEASGLKAVAAGNVGTAVSSVAGEPWDVVVVEASSFQLRFIDGFHPAAAGILNVAPDHLDWHGNLDSYSRAKARIFENMAEGDLLVYDGDDAGATELIRTAPVPAVPCSGRSAPEGGWGPVNRRLVVEGHQLPVPAIDGAFRLDLTVAAAVAFHVGATVEGVESVLDSFVPGAHRRQLVRERSGIAWVNDSKATNPHAAAAAASSYDSVVLIAGGRNKGLDLAPLGELGSVRHIVAYGEAAAELAAAAPARTTVVESLADAVTAAERLARAGDTVLLAPGCASFDQFDSYAERGEVFSALVAQLEEDQ